MSSLRGAIRNERGITLLVVLPMLLAMLGFAAAALRLTDAGVRFSAIQKARQRAFYVADGGLQGAVARLHADRLTASTSVSYTASGNGVIGGDPYSYTIVQDPMFPAEPTRKQIAATGSAANSTSTVISQVQVFPYDLSGTNPPGGTEPPIVPKSPTCDWALFADTGAVGLVNVASVATDLINGNMHSNNEIRIESTVAAAVRGSGRFESVGRVRTKSTASMLSTLAAELYRGGPLEISGAHLHAPFTSTPVFGIHFGNGSGSHGVQQVVAPLAFPVIDWGLIERHPSYTIVDRDHVPFGHWDHATDTWVSSVRVLPSEQAVRYFVRGNVRFEGITLARATDALIAARGNIEIKHLSLLQSHIGGILGVGLNSTQTLRLVAERNVYVGRGLLQSETAALGDVSQPGLNLSAALNVKNQIAGYSETGDVWVKSSAITALAETGLNLLGRRDATFAVTGSLASSPTTYCQQADLLGT